MENRFAVRWKELESTRPVPRRVRNVVKIDFDTFQELVFRQESSFVESITDSIYSGDAYIFEQALDPGYLKDLKHQLFEYQKRTPSTFHKLFDGCPDFHFRAEQAVGPKGGYVAIDHSFYFHPWNDDPLGLFSTFREKWAPIKVLSGYQANEFVGKIPSQGPTERIQVIHYPSGAGYISPHSDPWKNQKVIFGPFLTKRGVDYQTGGFYVFDEQTRKKRYIEDEVEMGSFVSVHPAVIHGVDIVDSNRKPNWNAIDGRWYIAFNSIDSHYTKNRLTAVPPAEGELI